MVSVQVLENEAFVVFHDGIGFTHSGIRSKLVLNGVQYKNRGNKKSYKPFVSPVCQRLAIKVFRRARVSRNLGEPFHNLNQRQRQDLIRLCAIHHPPLPDAGRHGRSRLQSLYRSLRGLGYCWISGLVPL